jgi:hypothetical protein
MLGHFMFLYMFPLNGVFVAAFLIPTNAELTYTALALATVPQVMALVFMLLYLSSDSDGCITEDDLRNGGRLWAAYDRILKP